MIAFFQNIRLALDAILTTPSFYIGNKCELYSYHPEDGFLKVHYSPWTLLDNGHCLRRPSLNKVIILSYLSNGYWWSWIPACVGFRRCLISSANIRKFWKMNSTWLCMY